MPCVYDKDPEQERNDRLWDTLWYKILKYPFKYSEVLMQLGFEPIAPVACRSIFGGTKLLLPNIFEYGAVAYIRKKDGFLGLYRGLSPMVLGSICGHKLGIRVANTLVGRCTEAPKDEIEISETELLDHFKRDAVVTISGIIISHPFHVISIRMMAQFIGRETLYKSIFGSIGEIYRTQGIWGFFAGLVPKLLYEVGCGLLTSSTLYVLHKYGDTKEKIILKWISRIARFTFTTTLYPLDVVSTCMTVTGSRLVAGRPPMMPNYENCLKCLEDLGRRNQLWRGCRNFGRTYR